ARAVAKHMERRGFRARVAGTLQEAEKAFREEVPDLILLDMRLPDGSGLDFLQRLREKEASSVPVLVFSAYGELEDAVAAMKLGAADYLKKPVDLDELMLNVEKVLANQAVREQLQYSHRREHRAREGVEFLGESPAIRSLREQAERIAGLTTNPGVEPPTVLITGETGTGKDVYAHLLHQLSGRRDSPFVQVDCASLPRDLIESELFGHEKGAFTNAHAARTGLIEAAEEGVLFLDEIGELSLDLQAKLLATLERRLVRRVGSTREHEVKAWFIAATNRNLEEMVAEGEFRSDLYYRLNVLAIGVPPLRERGDDILLLANHFIETVARRFGLPVPELTQEAVEAMRRYPWPGNVRELKHLIERAVLLSKGGEIGVAELMLPAGQAATPATGTAGLEGLTLDEAERLLIEKALERTGNNISQAARQLGVTRMAMRYRMKKYGLAE
ncbi:MAG: sigma-54-dependent Fis family transcriptional regulator, partial [Gammaproteobacteria bacterium]